MEVCIIVDCVAVSITRRSELYLLSPRAGPGTGTRDRESDMACTLLGQVGEHGEDLLAAEPAPSDIDNSVSARGSKKPKAVKEPKARAKKNEVATLSTSFTCWRKVPEPGLNLV